MAKERRIVAYPIEDMRMNWDRIRDNVILTAIMVLAVIAFGGCGRMEPAVGGAAANFDEIILSQAPNLEKKQAESQAPESTPEPVVLDILTKIQVEAGSAEQVTAADLFEEYDTQQVTFETNLSAKQLAAAGAVYEIDVIYREQPVKVTVECVDTTPPVIEGVKALTVSAGSGTSYKKGITWSDNADGEILFSVDADAVNLKVPGVYPVYYIAVDASGNETREETTVTVKVPEGPTEEEVNALADALIAQIITPEMSKYDIAYTLWMWCRTNMTYATIEKDYDTQWLGAYDGLHKKKGDCYTYCATYAFLLTRCGIDNICVSRVGGTSDHRWNLVNVGDGWYHCDASPRRTGDPYLCFMQTDAQVLAYTKIATHRPNYYVFDETLYPDRETTVIFGEDADSDSEEE